MKEQEIEAAKKREACESEIQRLRLLVREKEDRINFLENEKGFVTEFTASYFPKSAVCLT